MALEVARAYDENKNLVPLYIATDSDPVYDPVTPGFIYQFDNYAESSTDVADLVLNVMANAMNPSGGELSIINEGTRISFTTEISETKNPTITLKINNQSNFDIKVSFKCDIYNHYRSSLSGYYKVYTINIAGIDVSKNSEISSVTFDNNPYESDLTGYYTIDTLIIQRVL